MLAPSPEYQPRRDFLLNATQEEYDAQWPQAEIEDDEPLDVYDAVTSGWFSWEAFEDSGAAEHRDDEDLEEWLEREFA